MRLAIFQTSPTLGSRDRNIQAVNALLPQKIPTSRSAESRSVDLMILPELAFSGYNFQTKDDIAPYVETRTNSPSTQWAKEVAQRYGCKVLVGLPMQHELERWNAAILVDSTGEVIHEYQKYHMFETDYRWGCSPGPGFSSTTLDVEGKPVKMSVGICMDLNPWEFKAPFSAYEYANYILQEDISLILLPMAWLLPSTMDPESTEPSQPTAQYWLQRLHPLIDDFKTRTVVVCNRTGRENEAVYAGTSCVFRIGQGKATLLGYLGREEGVLELNVEV